MKNLLWISVLIALAACGEPRARDLGTRPDGGSSANSDGGVATESFSGHCATFTGYDRVGRKWRMQSDEAYEAQYDAVWWRESEIVALDTLTDHVRVEVTFDQSIAGNIPQGAFTVLSNGTVFYRCDASGLSLLEERASATSDFAGTPSTITETRTYTPPRRVLPAQLQIGASWSSTSTLTHAGTEDGEPFSTTSLTTYTATVLGQSSVTTPAGTFPQTWQVQTDWGTEVATAQWAEDVGYVADTAGHLVSYE